MTLRDMFFKLLVLLSVVEQLNNNWKRLLMLSHFLLELYNKSSMRSLKKSKRERKAAALFIRERKSLNEKKNINPNYRQTHIFIIWYFTIKTEIIIWSLWPEWLEIFSIRKNIFIRLNWILHVLNSFNFYRHLIANCYKNFN